MRQNKEHGDQRSVSNTCGQLELWPSSTKCSAIASELGVQTIMVAYTLFPYVSSHFSKIGSQCCVQRLPRLSNVTRESPCTPELRACVEGKSNISVPGKDSPVRFCNSFRNDTDERLSTPHGGPLQEGRNWNTTFGCWKEGACIKILML